MYRETRSIRSSRDEPVQNRSYSPGVNKEHILGTNNLTSRTKTLTSLLLLAVAVALSLLLLFVLFQRNPLPGNQDEYLPLLSLSCLTKPSENQSDLCAAYSRPFFGRTFPVLSYPYVGSLKGWLYYLCRLSAEVPTYRTFNAVLLGLFIIFAVWVAYRFGNGAPLCATIAAALLLTDISLLALGGTDEGPILLTLLFGCAFVFICLPDNKVSLLPPVAAAVIAFLGCWDRLNFLWFVGAGLAASWLVAPVTGRRALWRAGLTTVGAGAGLLAAFTLIPGHSQRALEGMSGSIPLHQFDTLWAHAVMLFGLLDPFSAYHRYVDVSSPTAPILYQTYSGVLMLLFAATLIRSLIAVIRKPSGTQPLERAVLLLSLFTAALIAFTIKTADAWSSHHTILVKPFIHLSVALAVVDLSNKWRGCLGHVGVAAGVLVLGGFYGLTGLKGYTEARVAPPIGGEYDVSWNAIRAVKHAFRADVETVYVLDWGAFYPGVAMSPPQQRWDMADVSEQRDLRLLRGSRRGTDFGLLFKERGAHAWLLTMDWPEWIDRLEQTSFSRASGESWVFLRLNTASGIERRYGLSAREIVPTNQIGNGSFTHGTQSWTHEKYGDYKRYLTFLSPIAILQSEATETGYGEESTRKEPPQRAYPGPDDGHVPDRRSRDGVVRELRLAQRRALLRKVRIASHARGSEREADALLVHGLPVLFQRPHRYADGAVEHSHAEMGDWYLSVPDQPEVGFVHEASPRPWNQPAQCMVHDAPYPRGVGRERRRPVRWPGGVR